MDDVKLQKAERDKANIANGKHVDVDFDLMIED
jgi:hypothetical protein